jgi:hypothetical protein
MFKGGMASMMQKAQKMQQEMQTAQEEIKKLLVTGSAGGGSVEICMNGEHHATSMRISDEAMSDKEMLEDLVLTAINDAEQQLSNASDEKMKNVAGGINLPPGMNLPF